MAPPLKITSSSFFSFFLVSTEDLAGGKSYQTKGLEKRPWQHQQPPVTARAYPAKSGSNKSLSPEPGAMRSGMPYLVQGRAQT